MPTFRQINRKLFTYVDGAYLSVPFGQEVYKLQWPSYTRGKPFVFYYTNKTELKKLAYVLFFNIDTIPAFKSVSLAVYDLHFHLGPRLALPPKMIIDVFDVEVFINTLEQKFTDTNRLGPVDAIIKMHKSDLIDTILTEYV